MEICLLTCRTPTAPYHSQSTEMVRLFHKWKNSRRSKSRLNRLTMSTFVFLQKSLFQSFLKNKVVLLLLTSPNNKIESEMTYNITATLDKLACTDYLDFGNCQDRFGRIFWSKYSFDYLDVKLKVFKRDENKQFRLAQNLTMGEADFNQCIRLKKQLVVAVRDFSKRENLPPVQAKLLAKDMAEQLKFTHKVVEVVDRPHRKICVTMLRYNVEKPETSYVQLRLLGRKEDEGKIKKNVYVNYKLDEFIYLLDVMKSVNDKVFANEHLCNVL